jgi:hypothetical protein
MLLQGLSSAQAPPDLRKDDRGVEDTPSHEHFTNGPQRDPSIGDKEDLTTY